MTVNRRKSIKFETKSSSSNLDKIFYTLRVVDFFQQFSF